MDRQFCATVYILQDDKVLLIYHRKHNKWLPPGGHIEMNEIPHGAAIREAKEETGLDIEIVSQENVWVDYPNARSIPRPYLMLLEEIPPHKDKPYHQHIDLIYLARPIGGELIQNEIETGGLRWWAFDEIETLKPGHDIFPDTVDILQKISQSVIVPRP